LQISTKQNAAAYSTKESIQLVIKINPLNLFQCSGGSSTANIPYRITFIGIAN